MRKIAVIMILCLALPFFLFGCGKEQSPQEETGNVMIANPWRSHESLEDAENAVGFELGLPESLGDGFVAESFRTMNNELLEVNYLKGEMRVCVRKQLGEGQDISGDYTNYEIIQESILDAAKISEHSSAEHSSVKVIISYQGYSWSLVAFNGFGENYSGEFLSEILK